LSRSPYDRAARGRSPDEANGSAQSAARCDRWQIIDFLPPAFLRYKEEQAATAGMAAAE
jgi:hypothetical protein